MDILTFAFVLPEPPAYAGADMDTTLTCHQPWGCWAAKTQQGRAHAWLHNRLCICSSCEPLHQYLSNNPDRYLTCNCVWTATSVIAKSSSDIIVKIPASIDLIISRSKDVWNLRLHLVKMWKFLRALKWPYTIKSSHDVPGFLSYLWILRTILDKQPHPEWLLL